MSVEFGSAIHDALSGAELLRPDEVRARWLAGGEVAVIDVSEGVDYQRGHLSVSVPVPASVIELHLARLLPRRDIDIVLVSSGDGELAVRTAARVLAVGYSNVSVLEGGSAGWAGAGYELITGPNSLSKAFGEFVERQYHTPKVSVAELEAKINGGADVVVLDSRPADEYHHVTIPTAVNAPGVELLYRAFDAVPTADAEVVVNCAGRTRAIIGAQALINASFPNKVFSLENGTGAWALAGLDSVRGASRVVGEPSAEGKARAAAGADRIATRFGVQRISAGRLDELRSARNSRSVYVIDVRTEEEFRNGHLPDSQWVAGGQLVQETDAHLGTRRGVVVLVDNAPSVRAILTASWLYQAGLDDVFVYELGDDDELSTGEVDEVVLGRYEGGAPSVTTAELERLQASRRVVVVDLEGERPVFARVPHIAGAVVARRSSLADALTKVDHTVETVVLTSEDGVVAEFATVETAHADFPFTVVALKGGTRAWRAAGGAVETGLNTTSLVPGEELTPSLSELPDAERQARLDKYVGWGDVVVDQLRRDGLIEFRSYPEPPHDTVAQ
ncbi:hypothetical protein CH267_12940 [Rhodococcus sp. 06-621-2]|nr:rhodanese-like domain-containing protein [Rhodococcus sp. 06-621-2]OZC55480.1 hypothetical protein CH267_12940 [Rhodococcus sp. 06-621-2]